MSSYAAMAERPAARLNSKLAGSAKWSVAFLGVLGYVLVEYTRLPAMFPILIPLQLGKIAVGIGALGLLLPGSGLARRGSTGGIGVGLVAVLVVNLVTGIFGIDASTSLWVWLDLARWATIFFLLSRTLNTSWRFRLFMFVYILLNIKLAQFSVRQYFVGVAYFNAQAMATFGAGAGSTGFFGNAGDFGVAMSVVFPIAGMLVFAEQKKSARLFYLVAFGAFLLAIIFCGSRGAVVGAGAAVLVHCLRNPKRLAGPVMALVFLGAIVYLLPGANKDRFMSALHPEKDKTASIRLALWKGGVQMFLDHPLFGVGPGNFTAAAPKYVDLPSGSVATGEMFAPHSIFIQAATDSGMIGLTVLGLLLLLFFGANYQTRKLLLQNGYNNKSFEYCLALGLDLGMVGFMGSGAFITVLYYPHLWLLLGLAGGLYRTAQGMEPAPPPIVTKKPKPRFAMGV